MALTKNVVTYTQLADGIPIIYAGQEQHFNGSADPYDREALWFSNYDTTTELYSLIKSLNTIRQVASASSEAYLTWHMEVVYNDLNNIAIRKGDSSYMTLMVVNNLGTPALDYTVDIPDVGFPANLTVVDILACNEVVVGSYGALAAIFMGGLPMVYYPYFLLNGTGICDY